MSQKEFGQLLGKPQPIVSRLQNPDYGKYSLQTLLEIASKLDVALLVRFVDYPTFLKVTSDFSDEALRPARYDQSQMDLLATKSYFTGHSIAAGEMAHASPSGRHAGNGGSGTNTSWNGVIYTLETCIDWREQKWVSKNQGRTW